MREWLEDLEHHLKEGEEMEMSLIDEPVIIGDKDKD